jgi:hypothetical protein
MTLDTIPALGLLLLSCLLFIRFGTYTEQTSPGRGHGNGLQGDDAGAQQQRLGVDRPEVQS